MILTPKEQDICRHYSTPDENHICHCSECPLNLGKTDPWRFSYLECYATVGPDKAKGVKRYK